jgi:serine/threonine-protein kinase
VAHAALGEAYLTRFNGSKDTKWVTEARSACSEALRLNDRLGAANGCLGKLDRMTGQYSDAINELGKALGSEPTNDDLYRELAIAQQAIGRADEAENTFKSAITLRPHYWANYNQLGVFYFSHGRYDDAVGMFKQVVTLAPDSVFGYTNLGGSYAQLGRYAEAIPVFERSVSIRPTARAYSNLGTAYFDRRQFASAVGAFHRAVELNGKDFAMWGNLGDAYWWAPGSRAESAAAYRTAISLGEEALKVNPRDPTILARLAGYHAMLDERQEAENLLERASAMAPTDPLVRFKAAMVFNHFNDLERTLDSLERAIQSGFSATVIRDTPDFDSLWTYPRFQQLLRGK